MDICNTRVAMRRLPWDIRFYRVILSSDIILSSPVTTITLVLPTLMKQKEIIISESTGSGVA